MSAARAELAHVRVVLVTDRRLAGGAELCARVAAIVAAVPRGTVLVQVREKDLDGAELLALARAVVVAAGSAPVWVNDRVDVARLAGASGVHLPESGLAIADARALAPELAIGCSRHAAETALAAAHDGCDLVQLGPCFATPDKSPIGLAPLTAVRAALDGGARSPRFVAVGGITGPDEARAAIRAGADAVAVIRAAWATPDPAAAVAALVAAADAAR